MRLYNAKGGVDTDLKEIYPLFVFPSQVKKGSHELSNSDGNQATMTKYLVCFLIAWNVIAPTGAFLSPHLTRATAHLIKKTTTTQLSVSGDRIEQDVDELLYDLAHKLKLEVFDLDDGIFGFESQDHRYGLEVVKTDIHDVDQGLGLVLTEMAGNPDGRGLVLVSEVSGNAAKAHPAIHVGDAITGVFAGPFRGRTTGLNYERTVEVITAAKEAAVDGKITLELNRLVERAKIKVEVLDAMGHITKTIDALAGENLRRLLLRQGIKLYDNKTKRFDMPYSTGDCAGEGICGTCLVDVKEGADLLNPKDATEHFITKQRPGSWRAACRAVVGAENKPGTIRVCLHPQSLYDDELNPGVKSVSMH